MKNFAQNPSFLKTLSVCIFFSGFGINNIKCVASDLAEDSHEEVDEGINSPSARVAPPSPDVFKDTLIPEPLGLTPFVIPDLQGQAFWDELISLKEDDAARDRRLEAGQTSFIAVTDLVSMFEDYDYEGLDFKTALLAPNFRLALTLNKREFEIKQYEEALANLVLFTAAQHWRPLQDSFFSLNQAIVLFRERILVLAEREKKLISTLQLFKKKGMKWQNKYDRLKTVKNKDLKAANETLTKENTTLKARVAQLEKEATERDALPLVNHVVVPAKESFSLWRWIKSLFHKAPKEPDETTKLINSDANNEV
ncbi:MAG: hypothetical protein BGO76_01075 [Caedibacter sp. 38-128]|nr:hypothetical protein [Holosporales bacterium]OJX05732.1 MAG: hypothetical protein BGO76_01075 [Caedibacter sp. 38-128]